MNEYEKEVFERLTAAEASVKSLHKRVDRHEQLIESIRQLVDEIKSLNEKVNEMGDKISDIESKPKKHWDTLITAAITAAASGVIGYLVALLVGG